MEERRYTTDEFAALLGTTNRNIRYLVAEGMLPRPQGSTPRVSYGPEHVEAYGVYQRLASLGFSVKLIQDLGGLDADAMSDVVSSIRRIASVRTTEEETVP